MRNASRGRVFKDQALTAHCHKYIASTQTLSVENTREKFINSLLKIIINTEMFGCKEAEPSSSMLVIIRPIMLHSGSVVNESHGVSAYSLYFTESIRLSLEKVKMS